MQDIKDEFTLSKNETNFFHYYFIPLYSYLFLVFLKSNEVRSRSVKKKKKVTCNNFIYLFLNGILSYIILN